MFAKMHHITHPFSESHTNITITLLGRRSLHIERRCYKKFASRNHKTQGPTTTRHKSQLETIMHLAKAGRKVHIQNQC